MKNKYALGWRPDPPDPRDMKLSVGIYSWPEKVDYTNQMTSVKNQGWEGACVGFAVTAVKEFQAKKLLKKEIDLAERWCYEYAKIYDPWPGSAYGGTIIRAAMKGLGKHGICEEEYWIYTSSPDGTPQPSSPKTGAEINAWKYRIRTNYITLTTFDGERYYINLNSIKHALNVTGPIAAGFMIYGDSETHDWANVGKDGLITYKGTRLMGGHAVCIVAYDDEKRLLKIKNSWGANWGQDGYGYITYEDAKEHCQSAWSAWDVEDTIKMENPTEISYAGFRKSN